MRFVLATAFWNGRYYSANLHRGGSVNYVCNIPVFVVMLPSVGVVMNTPRFALDAGHMVVNSPGWR